MSCNKKTIWKTAPCTVFIIVYYILARNYLPDSFIVLNTFRLIQVFRLMGQIFFIGDLAKGDFILV